MTSRRRIGILAGMLLLAGAAIAVYFILRSPSDPADDKSRTVKIPTVVYKAPLVIAVQASYPGANAQTVADTVAVPIEEQVNGVENMLSMSSQSANDGSYNLRVTFKEGTDLNMAQILVQNRVALATPFLPDLVRQLGMTVRKKSPEPLMLIGLISPDGRFDDFYLGKYAAKQVKDELARLPGIGDVVVFNQHDDRMRLALDVDKLATHNLSSLVVVNALTQQNIQVAGAIGQASMPKGQSFQLTINTLGRLVAPEELGNVIVKVSADGGLVRLKDVARIEMGANEGKSATLDGKPTALLGVHSLPNAKASDVSRAVVEKLAELWADAPAGIDYSVAFDFSPALEGAPTAAEHLVIDVQLPDSASLERTRQVLERGTKILLDLPGIHHVLALTGHPFSLVPNQPCLVVLLSPREQRELDRKQIAGKIQVALQEQIPAAVFRLCIPSAADGFPVYGYPIDFAIEDRGGYGNSTLRQRADEIVEKMMRNGSFTAAAVGPGVRQVPFLNLQIDRTKCTALGVEIGDVLKTLQVYLGSSSVSSFNEFGRTWQMTVKADPRFREQVSDISKLAVKNKQGQIVQLGTVMEVRDAAGPIVIERHNMYPIARITANLADGVSITEARSICETLAEQNLNKGMRLVWKGR